MKTKEIIDCINANGGLDIKFMRQNYLSENYKGSFESYVAGYIRNNYDCSRYVSFKVADYFIY